MTKPAASPRKAEPAAKPAVEAASAAAPTSKGDSRGKTDVLVALLRRTEGATVEDLMEATGWQAHSVRGAISGSVKKKLHLTVTSTKDGDTRVYRIVEAQA